MKVIDKVSYRDALIKVKSSVLQRTTDRVGDVRPLQTSTPIAAAASEVPPRPAPVQLPPARRELFQSTSETNRVEQNGATGVKPASDTNQPLTSLCILAPRLDEIDNASSFIYISNTGGP